MTEEIAPIYYISPTSKIHSDQCRHYKADTDGWQKIDSYSDALASGAKPCKICCPKTLPININESEKEIRHSTTEDKQESTSNCPVKLEETLDKSDTITPQQQDLFAQLLIIDNQLESSELIKENIKTEEQPESSLFTKEEGKIEEQFKSPTEDENKMQTNPESSKPNQEGGKTSKIKDKKTKSKKKPKEKKPPIKKYKILAGNGCHQAISEVQGILVPPIDDEGSHQLILPDGLSIQATFANSYLKWLAFNQPNISGAHWFRGYPKMKDDKLVALQIIGWDMDMPTSERGWEMWEFIGVWTLQKNLTVQRSMGDKEVRAQARETGFIKKFKYTFSNTQDWLKQKKLWSGYVYKLLCRREGDTLKIQKVIPYACPRKKPMLKGKAIEKKAPPNVIKLKQNFSTNTSMKKNKS